MKTPPRGPELVIPREILRDADGVEWVFVGYGTNTRSTELVFARVVQYKRSWGLFTYHAVERDTLFRKFPSLGQPGPDHAIEDEAPDEPGADFGDN